jgi:prepilin-type N-terminal cleavage/methylation domain-containing protein
MKHERGMSMIELMLAIAIAGVVSAAIVTMATNAMRTTHLNDLQTEAEALRRYLTEAISCDATLRPEPSQTLVPECTGAGTYLKVLDAANQIIIDKPSSRFGSHLVRARCPVVGGERRLVVEHLYATKDGTPALNPVTRQPSTWGPLFKTGLSPCNTDFSPKEILVYDDLQMDPLTMISVAAFLLGVYEGPVVACADSEWPDPMWMFETSLSYQGFAQCPRGYTLVGGGVDCSASPTGEPEVDWVPALNSGMPMRRKSFRLHSEPVFDEVVFKPLPERVASMWHGTCCIRVNTIPTGSVNIPLFPLSNRLKDRVYARCVRNANG